jgi:large subunit ribosomal protein L22
MLQLKFCNRFVSKPMLKILNSAVANSQKDKVKNIENLYVNEVRIGKSMTLKRTRPRAKGRIDRVSKYYSNIGIILREKV